VASGTRDENSDQVVNPWDCLESVYEDHFVELQVLARRLLRDPSGASDLVHEAFVRVYATSRRPETEPELLRYLARTVINLSREQQRRSLFRAGLRRRLEQAALNARSSEEAHVDDQILGHIAQLPRRQREVILLRYWMDLTTEETAALLGISDGAVKTHAARARAALQLALANTRNAEDES
jgi:RNA polymerase sigma factor (sigma-70 family)